MSELVIENNLLNGGFCCEFEYRGKYYYADLCFNRIIDNSECMIFNTVDTKDGRKIDYGRESFSQKGIPISEEALCECIEYFIKRCSYL